MTDLQPAGQQLPAKNDPFADDFDAIHKWYTDPDKFKISDTQAKQLKRWKFAREWFTNFEPVNDLEVVRALTREFGVSERQAYTDVKNCKRFFITVDETNEEFEKVQLIERTKRLRNKAIKSGTTKGLEIAAKCDATLVKIYGFDRERALMPEPKIVLVEVNTDPATVGAVTVENFESLARAFRRKKEEKPAADNIQDVDFEEVMNKPRNERQHERPQ